MKCNRKACPSWKGGDCLHDDSEWYQPNIEACEKTELGFQEQDDATMKPEEWIVNGEVGISSKTIWAVMMGAVMKEDHHAWLNYSVPRDPDDLSRCIKLLALVKGWRERLPEVVATFPEWGPLVREWESLERMGWKWIADEHGLQDLTNAEALYELMQQLIQEGKMP